MAQVIVTESSLENIAGAIRSKLGTQTTYKPAQMAGAIAQIHGDPVLEVLNVNANGTYTPSSGKDGFSRAVVNVPNSYSSSDEGKVVSNGALVGQSSQGINANGTYNTTLKNEVVVNVPNSYSASDEGKVVDNGALVAQSSQTITENGTYNTTLKNQIVVNVSGGGGGGQIIFGTDNPTSATGSDGDTYVKYHNGLSTTVTVTGGYNGGAVVAVMIENTQVFTATASDTYNLNYDITQADVSTDIGTVSILITPPSSSTDDLYITVTGPNNTITCNPPKQGGNTSYGYGNYSNTDYLIGTSGERIADALYIKQNGAWKGVGDEV